MGVMHVSGSERADIVFATRNGGAESSEDDAPTCNTDAKQAELEDGFNRDVGT